MRISISIHSVFWGNEDEVSVVDNFEKAMNKLSKKKAEQGVKILTVMADEEWHQTVEIAESLGLKDIRINRDVEGIG